jgi:hypothetical protein
MSDDLAGTPCRACRNPVFEGGKVVLCSRCDSYQHVRCWTAAGRCGATVKCRGKPVPVAVVKLQPPGPSAAEIAEAVEARTQEILHPIIADLRSAMAHAEDVDALRKTVAQSAETAQERVEALRREVESRTERIRQLVAAVETRLAGTPVPIDRNDLARIAKDVREGGEAGARLAGAAIEAHIEALRRAVSVDLHEVLLAVEACRWDTAARRHPLPWDGRTDDVLAPRGSGPG